MKRPILSSILILLILFSAGCTQSNISQNTIRTSSSISSISPSPSGSMVPTIKPKAKIEDFRIDLNWNDETNTIVLYLVVENQTGFTKVNGVLKLHIVDKFGFEIYNGTIQIRKTDFHPYTEEFQGITGNLTKITIYKARYIILDFQKGLADMGIINASLTVENITLKRTFLAFDLPTMSKEEREKYFENLYLKNAKPLNITQTKEDVRLEIYRYGVYINPMNFKKYLRIDARLRNVGSYTIELKGEMPAKLTVDGFPLKEYYSGFWYGYSKELEPDEYMKERFLFPMDEISLDSKDFVFKVQRVEIIPERKVTIKLCGLKPLLDYKAMNIVKAAQKFPIEATLVKYAVFEYETFEGKERGIKVVLRIKNTGNKDITIDLNGISLGGSVGVASSDWFLTVNPNSEKEAWLVFPYVQGKTELIIPLHDWIEGKEEFLEIPFEIKEVPKPNEIVVNKTIEAYPFVVTLEKVEKTPYFEISELKPLVKVYFKLKNIGEVEHWLNIDDWKLIFSGGTDNGNLIMSKITGETLLRAGSVASGHITFDDVLDASEYTLEIEIPQDQKTLEFELRLPIKLEE